MYEKFFNLHTKPFELVPNPDFLYLSKPHKKAISYLDYGIKEKAGFILLTGEVGSGKTTIVRNLIKGLNGNTNLSMVFNTKVSSDQLIAMINEDFNLDVTGKDKITLLRDLNDFLVEQYANKSQPILIIDEAQNLSLDLLEEVRMLSNLETDKCKLLQIILVGQPELRQILAKPELRQLRQRISISSHIQPLTRKETKEYIQHRLYVAGNVDAVKFSEETFDVIHNFSKGIPRLINIVCDFLMLSAFVEETRELTVELVKEVIGELDVENRYWQDENAGQPVPDNSAPLQVIIDRLDRLEEGAAKREFTNTDKIEILERLIAAEKILNNLLHESARERSGNEMKVFKEEIMELRRITDELGKRIDSGNGAGKGFFRMLMR